MNKTFKTFSNKIWVKVTVDGKTFTTEPTPVCECGSNEWKLVKGKLDGKLIPEGIRCASCKAFHRLDEILPTKVKVKSTLDMVYVASPEQVTAEAKAHNDAQSKAIAKKAKMSDAMLKTLAAIHDDNMVQESGEPTSSTWMALVWDHLAGKGMSLQAFGGAVNGAINKGWVVVTGKPATKTRTIALTQEGMKVLQAAWAN